MQTVLNILGCNDSANQQLKVIYSGITFLLLPSPF